MIHPTAVLHPTARIDPTVQIGPYAVVDSDVVIGPRCWIGPHVHLTGWTEVGADNRFHTGCVIGDAPQDLKHGGEPTRLTIGERNTFREHVTVHRSNNPEQATQVGSDNLLMAHSHVGHNSRLGNKVILANGAQLGGHVEIGDGAFLSGHAQVHQFVRVGTLALMQGQAGISLDLPPFTIVRGINGMCGLNAVGMRRAGLGPATRLELKRLYHLLFRSGQRLRVALEQAATQFTGAEARLFIEFVSASQRGLCHDTSRHQPEPDA